MVESLNCSKGIGIKTFPVKYQFSVKALNRFWGFEALSKCALFLEDNNISWESRPLKSHKCSHIALDCAYSPVVHHFVCKSLNVWALKIYRFPIKYSIYRDGGGRGGDILKCSKNAQYSAGITSNLFLNSARAFYVLEYTTKLGPISNQRSRGFMST